MTEIQVPEELDEKEEGQDREQEAVPVHSESYASLRKMVKKHSIKFENLLQENRKLCRDFQKKKVRREDFRTHLALVTTPFVFRDVFKWMFNIFFLDPFPSHPGASFPCWSRGKACRLGKRKRTFLTSWRRVRCWLSVE